MIVFHLCKLRQYIYCAALKKRRSNLDALNNSHSIPIKGLHSHLLCTPFICSEELWSLSTLLLEWSTSVFSGRETSTNFGNHLGHTRFTRLKQYYDYRTSTIMGDFYLLSQIPKGKQNVKLDLSLSRQWIILDFLFWFRILVNSLPTSSK
jgi:hypothetical protein